MRNEKQKNDLLACDFLLDLFVELVLLPDRVVADPWRPGEGDDDDAHVVPAPLVQASVDHLVGDGLEVGLDLHPRGDELEDEKSKVNIDQGPVPCFTLRRLAGLVTGQEPSSHIWTN